MTSVRIAYHWSPRRYRGSITEHGLLPSQPSTSQPGHDGFRWDAVCLGPTPQDAWTLSAYAHGPFGLWDLWQVSLVPGDGARVAADFGHWRGQELRVSGGIPPDRVWWVGERTLDRSSPRFDDHERES